MEENLNVFELLSVIDLFVLNDENFQFLTNGFCGIVHGILFIENISQMLHFLPYNESCNTDILKTQKLKVSEL